MKKPYKVSVHPWEIPRKNYLQSPSCSPVTAVNSNSLRLVSLSSPRNQNHKLATGANATPTIQPIQQCTAVTAMHTHRAHNKLLHFQPCFLPTAVLTWLTDNTFHMLNKKEISLKFRCRGNEQIECNSSRDFHFYFLLCSFPSFTNWQLWRDTRKLRKCNWYFVAVAYSCERFSQISWVPWR